MAIKVYTSGISGNKEVKKRQQRIMMVLESKNIKYEAIDITEPGNEQDKQFMQDHAKPKEAAKHAIPPQIFNEDDYCGDYDGFDLANENDELEIFLKLPLPPAVNGKHSSEKGSSESPLLERNEDIINAMVPNNVDEVETKKEVEVPEENIHGFCYTPALAKRLERALRSRIRKSKPKPVHGYCYTPSLAQRLAKALENSVKRRPTNEENIQQPNNLNNHVPMDEDNHETDSSIKNEEMDEGNENLEDVEEEEQNDEENNKDEVSEPEN